MSEKFEGARCYWAKFKGLWLLYIRLQPRTHQGEVSQHFWAYRGINGPTPMHTEEAGAFVVFENPKT